jgi:hypothetical protein
MAIYPIVCFQIDGIKVIFPKDEDIVQCCGRDFLKVSTLKDVKKIRMVDDILYLLTREGSMYQIRYLHVFNIGKGQKGYFLQIISLDNKIQDFEMSDHTLITISQAGELVTNKELRSNKAIKFVEKGRRFIDDNGDLQDTS